MTIPRYEQLSYELADSPDSPRIALIGLPPHEASGSLASTRSRCVLGRLSGEREWFVQTPLVVQVVDGKVTAIGDWS